ncbi:XTP/dITP diphosphatase [Paenibacillus endoradicis]|uniref:XTP/dITP diphosphatase n=1 Tax=Paenibacillus endoradicis TaxID=2972487 RepID=UPI0021592475|nr:XTP/dITP diphosphatase [Paenibacillus endoradicis]MCR8657991.1 XTP/dITP diphosphatase [Paenibacillus endoradicis]
MSALTTIVIATKNEGKVKEFAHAFAKLGIEVKSLFDYPSIPDIVEDGDTFIANAKIKAKVTGDAIGVPVLADDSGLSVDALDGAPGVYSARFSGEGATDASNNEKLIQQLQQLNAKLELDPLTDGSNLLSHAQFRCALALYIPDTEQFVVAEGLVAGIITDKPHGAGGFGYDPYFYVPQLDCSMAQLSKEEKGKISHRGEALKQLMPQLRTTFDIK